MHCHFSLQAFETLKAQSATSPPSLSARDLKTPVQKMRSMVVPVRCVALPSSSRSGRALTRQAASFAVPVAPAPVLPTPALLTPVAEGYAWVQQQLDKMLVGLEAKTPRAHVVATKVPHIHRATLAKRKLDMKPRCTSLIADIAWEARAPQPVTGVARVTLDPRNDRVTVTDITACTGTLTPDVAFAVASMDGALMAQLLNTFMWQVEQCVIPEGSFEEDDPEDLPSPSCPVELSKFDVEEAEFFGHAATA